LGSANNVGLDKKTMILFTLKEFRGTAKQIFLKVDISAQFALSIAAFMFCLPAI